MKYPKCNKIIITKDRSNLIKIKWIVQKKILCETLILVKFGE